MCVFVTLKAVLDSRAMKGQDVSYSETLSSHLFATKQKLIAGAGCGLIPSYEFPTSFFFFFPLNSNKQ